MKKSFVDELKVDLPYGHKTLDTFIDILYKFTDKDVKKMSSTKNSYQDFQANITRKGYNFMLSLNIKRTEHSDNWDSINFSIFFEDDKYYEKLVDISVQEKNELFPITSYTYHTDISQKAKIVRDHIMFNLDCKGLTGTEYWD